MSGRSRQRGNKPGGVAGPRIRFLLFLFLFLYPHASAAHAWGMRCGSGIVSQGDTKSEVLDACGSPACTRPIESGRVLKWKAGVFWPLAADEEWVYDFGPHRFVHRVRFYHGEVVDTESGGYGTPDGRACPDRREDD